MNSRLLIAAAAALLTAAPAEETLAAPEKTECLAGAKPGGGFDVTCRLAANALLAAKLIDRPMTVSYMEGGVGAIAYNHVVGKRSSDPGLVVASRTLTVPIRTTSPSAAAEPSAARIG